MKNIQIELDISYITNSNLIEFIQNLENKDVDNFLNIVLELGFTNYKHICKNSGLYSPSVGRPIWEVTITFAPSLRQYLIVANEASILWEDVIFPDLIGTFRSARIKTFLFFKSKS